MMIQRPTGNRVPTSAEARTTTQLIMHCKPIAALREICTVARGNGLFDYAHDGARFLSVLCWTVDGDDTGYRPVVPFRLLALWPVCGPLVALDTNLSEAETIFSSRALLPLSAQLFIEYFHFSR